MLIKNARFVVTDNKILENKDILFHEKIEEIGENLDKSGDVIDASGCIVIPGLTNSHTHLPMTLLRGVGENLPLDKWLREKIWPLEAKLKASDVYWGSLLGCLEMIKTGTTHFNDMYFFEDEVARATVESGLKAFLGSTVIDFPTPETKNPLKRARQFIRKWKNKHPRINPTISPHAIYTCSKENLLNSKDIADKFDVRIHIHLSETQKEVNDSIRKNNMRPAEYLDKLGLISQKAMVAHCCWLSDREIKLLSERGATVLHCPVSNQKLHTGKMPLSKMLKEGVNVSLGTDGCASNNNLDLFEEMKFCALTQDAGYEQVFKISHNMTNKIKEGQAADMVLLDINSPFLRPCSKSRILSHLVYTAPSSAVKTVICSGKILMLDRKVLTLDEEKIYEKISRIKDKFD